MFRWIINYLPVWLLFIINFSIYIILVLFGTYLSRVILSSKKIDTDYSRTTDSILGILGGAYGFFLGFVIVTLWNTFTTAQKIVYQEADAVGILGRSLTTFPASWQMTMDNDIDNYIRTVRVNEWEAMRNGKSSPLAWNAINQLYFHLHQYTPASPKETLYYLQVVNNLNDLLKKRRDRLFYRNSILDNSLRTALILGAAVIAFMTGLLKGQGQQGAMRFLTISTFGLVIVFNLTLALNFDYPFSGKIAVSNAPFYQGVLQAFY